MDEAPLTPAETDQLFRLLRRAIGSVEPDETLGDRLDPSYDDATCAMFVETLGDAVLDRAVSFFEGLRDLGELSSVELAYLLGAAPRELSGLVTGALKKRAAKLGLPQPFDVDETDDGTRTLWRDRDDIAKRMVNALRKERDRRGGLPMFRGTKYQLLEEALASLGADDVVLSFEDIERIIGEALPPSARSRRQWWANSDDRHVQAQAWLRAGFGAYPKMADQVVIFRRSKR